MSQGKKYAWHLGRFYNEWHYYSWNGLAYLLEFSFLIFPVIDIDETINIVWSLVVENKIIMSNFKDFFNHPPLGLAFLSYLVLVLNFIQKRKKCTFITISAARLTTPRYFTHKLVFKRHLVFSFCWFFCCDKSLVYFSLFLSFFFFHSQFTFCFASIDLFFFFLLRNSKLGSFDKAYLCVTCTSKHTNEMNAQWFVFVIFYTWILNSIC